MHQRGLVAILLVGALAGLGGWLYFSLRPSHGRTARLRIWLRDPSAHPDWRVGAGTRCGQAPLLFPTDGFIGYLWGDSFRGGHPHQGIDVFSGSGPGQTAVVSAFPGLLTRLPGWKSAVIVRIPSDPLQPGQTIWLYYTHMADENGNSFIAADFPPGTFNKPVQAGTLLGYQGDYTGDPDNPTGVHLHFSIVMEDGKGGFRNELDIHNTIDPSPYLGLPLNAKTSHGSLIVCQEPVQ
jgi:hypothetical protein